MSAFSTSDLDTFAAVCERDVDLMIVLAVTVSRSCRKLFARSVGREEHSLVTVQHSVSTEGREADIVLCLGEPSHRVVLEIEDKLDARFQEGQAAAYAERATHLSQADDIEVAKAVLIAPEAYLAGVALERAFFNGTVSYEQLRDLLITEEPWGRAVALVLEHAIRQHRRGGKSSPDDESRTRFFNEFARRAAELGLPAIPEKGRKAGAGFLWYPRKKTLTQPVGWNYRNASHGAWLVAKFTDGFADVELTGIRRFLNLDQLKESLTSEGLRVEADKKSVRLRKKAPVLDPDRPPLEQFDEVTEFIERLVWLRDWWEGVGRGAVEASLSSRETIT